ncbi:hypothetical protein D3C73_1477200 [compost metagenome]
MVVNRHVLLVIEILQPEEVLSLGHTILSQRHRFDLDIYGVILVQLQILHKSISSKIQLCRLLSCA